MLSRFKKLSASVALTLGIVFTLFLLLSIWEAPGFGNSNAVVSKLIPTLGVLTLAFIVLLAIIKMTEERK